MPGKVDRGQRWLHSGLAELLLASEVRAQAAAGNIDSELAWDDAISLANQWRVTPQLAARLRSISIDLPSPSAFLLRRAVIDAFRSSAMRSARGVEAITALKRAGIRATAFKGLAAISLLYGSPRERTIRDADLIVAEADVSAALSCLEVIGFARRGNETFDQYVQFAVNSPGFAGNLAVTLYAENEGEIDLHWRVGTTGMTVEGLLDRSINGKLGASEISVVHPADGFLLTAQHSVRDNLTVESALRDLLDLRLSCEMLLVAGHLDELARRACETRLLVPAIAVTTILRGYDPTEAICSVAEILSRSATAEQSKSAAGLSRAFHYQLERGNFNKDLLYLVHSRPIRQVLNGLRNDWSGYRKSQHSVEDQLNQRRSLTRRAMELMKSAVRPGKLNIAREVARAKFETKL
jgi:hypothetical protein